MRNKLLLVVSLLIVASMVLGACGPQQTPAASGESQVTKVVETVEVMVEGTPMVVTATPPPPAPPAEFKSKDPNTFVHTTFGEPEGFDPALAYETAGGEIIQNVYETLIWYNKDQAAEFIPQLAAEVPTAENGGITNDGKTYTFKIREGVKFHNGADMTAADVAYSFVRGVLQGGTASPQWLLTEPFFGIGVDDISVLVEAATATGVEALGTETLAPLSAEAMAEVAGEMYDDVEKLKAADPAVLAAVCERAKAAVVADDAAGTVTINLAQAWAPFIPTIANTWGSVMDQEWVAENGGWDGDCATWQNFYAITSENNPFSEIMNGTGPYKLESWTHGEEIVLVRNDDYWRTDPMWEGGPSGPAQVERVILKSIDEWGTRFAMTQAGDTDTVIVNRENVTQIDPLVGERCEYNAETGTHDCAPTENPDGPLSLFIGHPLVNSQDVFFTFNINVEGGNPFVGSGQLDGNGIPADFFSDINVRKGFNYCFDWETYIQDAMVGEAVQSVGIPMAGMPGHDPNAEVYTFDMDKCAEAFQASELKGPNGESLWDIGFRMQVAYNTGNTNRQTVAEILATNLSLVNELFQVEIIGLPWPTFLRAQRNETLPLFISGWQEDIHDPHNWYVPYLTGTYGRRQNVPEEIVAGFQELINAGVAETDPTARHETYLQLNQQVHDLAPQILLAIPTGRHYEQRWVDGYYFNPMYGGFYYYAFSKQ